MDKGQFKYGVFFNLILDIIKKHKVFDSSETNLLSLELCQSFFETLDKELSYHNYVLSLESSDYLSFIHQCLHKAIHVRHTAHISEEQRRTIAQKMQQHLTIYIDQWKNSIKKHIQQAQIPQAGISPSFTQELISSDELETYVSQIRHTCHPSRKVHYVDLPHVKIHLMGPKPPLLEGQRGLTHQKGLLDLDVEWSIIHK